MHRRPFVGQIILDEMFSFPALSLIVLTILIGSSLSQEQANATPAEVNALSDLFTATGGANWTWHFVGERWNFSGNPNPCLGWQGVNCTTEQPDSSYRHILELNLPGFNLNGTIPATIYGLEHLSVLVLDNNPLRGSIPVEIGANLHNLTYMSLQNNEMTGLIPDSLGKLTNLTYLALTNSGFNGSIPESLGDLGNLETLMIVSTEISGTIPAKFNNSLLLSTILLNHNSLDGCIPRSLCDLTALSTLYLGGNKLSGPVPGCFGTMAGLTELSLHGNFLHGLIPSTFGELPSAESGMFVLDLSANNLTGQIPPALGNLGHLKHLYLGSNSLTGNIPTSLGDLANLLVLDLAHNKLNGTIPEAVGHLSSLRILSLSDNFLTGSVTATIGNLSNLTELVLSSNLLTGTIPAALGNLFSLKGLSLYRNLLRGSVPSSLGRLTKLRDLELGANELSGTLPGSFGNLTALRHLNLYYNGLSGTLPASMGNLTELRIVELIANKLSGPIPENLGSLSHLSYLDLCGNKMTGTLHKSLFELPNLQFLTLCENALSGPIPVIPGKLTNLLELDMYLNLLTGTLPPALSHLSQLVYLDISYNLITGRLPEELSQLDNLKYLSLSTNKLVGTLPAKLAELRNIVGVDLQTNHFTGCIPRFGQQVQLKVLKVSSNLLSCSLDGVFSGVAQSHFTDIDVSYNHLTGSLPVELFRLPELSTLVMTSNCFTGSLPVEVCGQAGMQFLILDGLHTATTCRERISAISHSYTVNNGFHGTIPPCIFNLPQLEDLHLSGNGLTGGLPVNMSLAKQFVQLTLSHNSLTGEIPTALQKHSWNMFDLSYNRLSGSLAPNFGTDIAANSSVFVQDNRLSGQIPSPIVNFVSISTLGSNMFSCNVDKSNLPQHDNEGANYQCGSNSFDGAFYSLLTMFAVLVTVMCWVRWYPRRSAWQAFILRFLDKWRLPKGSVPQSCQRVYSMAGILCQVGVYSALMIVLVLMPWYAVASSYWGTYDHQYIWVVSAAFLSGFTPGLVEFSLFTALLVAVIAIVVVVTVQMEKDEVVYVDKLEPETSPENAIFPVAKRSGVYALFLITNVTVVVGINVIFVLVYLTQSSAVLILFQILLSLFKFFWNSVCTRKLIEIAARGTGQRDQSAEFFTVQAFIGLFNNIAVPCLVVSVLSPSCFYDVFVTPSQVSSEYPVYGCLHTPYIFTACTGVTMESIYDPPFSYDYQCSSSFITYYASAFIYLAITAAFLNPMGNALMLYCYHNLKEGSILHKIVTPMLQKRLKPIQVAEENRSSSPYFDANNMLVTLFIYLGVLLTFGVVFPPVAVAMCIAMLSVAWQAKLSLGRLLCNAREIGAQYVIDAVEQDCSGVASLDKLRGGMLMIVGFGYTFYAMFVFDTLGDALGLSGAYWVLIVMPLMSLGLFTVVRGYRYFVDKKSGKTQRNYSLDGRKVEMRQILKALQSQSQSQAENVGVHSSISTGVVSALHEGTRCEESI